MKDRSLINTAKNLKNDYNTKNINNAKDINSRKAKKQPDRITHKKDFKLLMSFFAVEAAILVICMAAAHFKVKGDPVYAFKGSGSYAEASESVIMNIMEKSFNGSGMDVFSNAEYESGGAGDNQESPESLQYKYYTFNLSESGITSNVTKAAPGTQMKGITSNTATSTIIEPSKSALKLGQLTIRNDYVYESLDITDILSKPLVIEPMDSSSILIYHVHATEGYCKNEDEKYNTGTYAVPGEENNVVYAGNVLSESIFSRSGIKVIHDKTVFKEGNTSSIAYNNAALRLDEIYRENKNIKLQIDLHRNSADLQNGVKYGPTVSAEGNVYAPFSFVIGLDWDNATGNRSEYANPYWKDNFKLCFLIIEKLEEKVPGIVRQIELRRTPYNQNYAENSLLVEIGFDGNLTSEAEASAKLFGEVLGDIYS